MLGYLHDYGNPHLTATTLLDGWLSLSPRPEDFLNSWSIDGLSAGGREASSQQAELLQRMRRVFCSSKCGFVKKSFSTPPISSECHVGNMIINQRIVFKWCVSSICVEDRRMFAITFPRFWIFCNAPRFYFETVQWIKIWVFPWMGVPLVIIHFRLVFSIINHPAIGVLPFIDMWEM